MPRNARNRWLLVQLASAVYSFPNVTSTANRAYPKLFHLQVTPGLCATGVSEAARRLSRQVPSQRSSRIVPRAAAKDVATDEVKPAAETVAEEKEWILQEERSAGLSGLSELWEVVPSSAQGKSCYKCTRCTSWKPLSSLSVASGTSLSSRSISSTSRV
jgi:hypothetical protein